MIYIKEVKHHIAPPTEKDESKKYITLETIEMSMAGNSKLLRYPQRTVIKTMHATNVVLQESLRYSDANRLESLRFFATVAREIPSTKIGTDMVKLKLTHVFSADNVIMPDRNDRAAVIVTTNRMVTYVISFGLKILPMSIVKNL